MAAIESIQIFTRDELHRLFKAIPTRTHQGKRNRAIFYAAYHYCLRASEVGLLERADVDFQELRIYVHRLKAGNSGTYPLHPSLSRVLKSYLRARTDCSPILFPSNRLLPINRRTLHVFMRQYGEKANIPAGKRHFHVLRHTGVTHFLESTGGSTPLAQDRAGHRSSRSTEAYIHLTTAYRDEATREAFRSGKMVTL